MKKALSVILALALIFSVVPLSGISEYLQGLDFSFLAVKSTAASTSDLSFKLNDDGESYSVSACNKRASGALEIPSTYNGKPVTSIGFDAFSECENLTSVTIPGSVTDIGYGAFNHCANLASVTIPDSVTSIEGATFQGCDSLTSVTIPDSVTSIGEQAFYCCSSLTSVNIPDGVTSIGYYAFAYCSSLTSVTIPDSVTNIEHDVFYYCSATLIIHSHLNTAAEAYAKANGIIWEDLCKHLHTENHAAVVAQSCLQTGYTAGVFCLDCNNWIFGHKEFTGPHTDSNYDYICEVCSVRVCDIIPDETKEITVEAGETKLLKFTPYVTETYVFTSKSYLYMDTFGYLYDADMNVLKSGDNSEVSYNFKIEYTLIAGETYYFGARFYSEYVSYGSFNVSLSVYSPFTYTLNEDGDSYTLSKCDSSYSGEVIIPATYNGKTVTRIGGSAFSGCSGLKSIEIPDSVTSIGNYAFYNCSKLTSVTIPDSVTSIGNYAFSGCSSLTSVAIPDSVTSIGEYAFWDCSSLTSVTIGNGVTNIGYGAFYWCSSLTSVTIPDSVTSIGDAAFERCSSLTSVTIGNGVTSIGENAFYRCSSLTSVTIPDSVTSIDWYAFGYTDFVTGRGVLDGFVIYSHLNTAAEAYAKANGIIWEDSCKHLHTENRAAVAAQSCSQPGYTEGVFCLDCNRLISGHEEIIIPHTDSNRDYYCDDCSDCVCDIIPDETKEITVEAGKTTLLKFTPYKTEIYEFTLDSGNDTYGYLYDADMNVLKSDNNSAGNGKIKYTLEAGKTYYFGARFYNKYYSGSLNVSLAVYSPFTFTLNEDGSSYTFASCDQSYSGEVVVIPSTYKGKPVTGIGDYVFKERWNIISVTIPDNVTNIGYGAFYNCRNLKSVTIPDSVKSIGDNAFYYCSRLTSITIPDSVTSIGLGAFSSCSRLVSINVAAGNNDYSSQDGVLFNKDKTELICCPGGNTGAYTIPSSVTSIGGQAFYYCRNLTSVTIPDSVTSIGDRAFEYCSSLTTVTIPDSVTSIGEYAFRDCRSLTSVTIPDSVTSIGSSAFEWCSSLTSVTIPDSVTSIGEGAFSRCSSLTSVAISDSVTSIGEYAFWDCSSLTSVTIGNGVTSIGDYAFEYCGSLVLYGFSGSYAEAYADGHSIAFQAVKILPNANTRIDYANKCIFSEKSIKSLDDCLICDPNIALECVKSGFGVIGTGALVNVKSGDAVIDTYTVVVNGDLDGDSVCDVLDMVLAERAANGHGELSAAQAYAANNSADTEISIESYQNVVNRALGA